MPSVEARFIESGDMDVVDPWVELVVADPIRLPVLEHIEGFDVFGEEITVGTRCWTSRHLCHLRRDSGRACPSSGRMALDVARGDEDRRRSERGRGQGEECAEESSDESKTDHRWRESFPHYVPFV
jgi:hypothetical protein